MELYIVKIFTEDFDSGRHYISEVQVFNNPEAAHEFVSETAGFNGYEIIEINPETQFVEGRYVE